MVSKIYEQPEQERLLRDTSALQTTAVDITLVLQN